MERAAALRNLINTLHQRPRPASPPAPLAELGRVPRRHWPLARRSVSGLWLSNAADGSDREPMS